MNKNFFENNSEIIISYLKKSCRTHLLNYMAGQLNCLKYCKCDTYIFFINAFTGSTNFNANFSVELFLGSTVL